MDIKRQSKRIAIGIAGGIVLIIGIILVPYPGPGWVVIFAGLGILSTEFDWAKDTLQFARGKYDAWQEWMKRQSTWVRVFFWLLTCLVVIVTVWLLNGYGFINDFLHLGLNWVKSPIPIFH